MAEKLILIEQFLLRFSRFANHELSLVAICRVAIWTKFTYGKSTQTKKVVLGLRLTTYLDHLQTKVETEMNVDLVKPNKKATKDVLRIRKDFKQT